MDGGLFALVLPRARAGEPTHLPPFPVQLLVLLLDAFCFRFGRSLWDRVGGCAPSPRYHDRWTAGTPLLILLTAVDAGLGAFYFSLAPTGAEIPLFHQAFGIPEEYEPIGALAIGYPAPDRPSPSLRRGRRPPTQVLHFGAW